METSSQHHFRFRVDVPIAGSSEPSFRYFEAGVAADSHAEGLNAVAAAFPSATRLELRGIDKIGDGCGDTRCAVCNPSSRNQGTL